MPADPVVAVEIGTSKVVALVGEQHRDGHVIVIGMGECPSQGVRKGEVVDADMAEACVRTALIAAESSSQVKIVDVHVAVTGGHIQGTINSGVVPVSDSGGEVSEADVDKVEEVARALSLPADREILHSLRRGYSVDDGPTVATPAGMAGVALRLEMMLIHGVRTRLRNTVKVIADMDLTVGDIVFSGVGTARAVLSNEQKKNGVVVIDLGGGATEYMAYANGALAAAGALAVGGEHVTNDIAIGFNIPTAQAERCKCQWGAAAVDPSGGERRVAIPQDAGFPGRAISLKALNTVINARVTEIFEMVRKQLDQPGILSRAGGVVIAGGGAHLRGIADAAEAVFGVPCAVGKPRGVAGIASVIEAPQYATCIGVVQCGFLNERGRPRGAGIGHWIGRWFGR